MKTFVQDQSGAALILVLMLLAMGTLLLIPMLGFTFTAQASGQVQTRLLKEQYSRDAGSEYAVWQLIHGGATALLNNEGEETTFPLELNGVSTTVRIRLQAELRLAAASTTVTAHAR